MAFDSFVIGLDLEESALFEMQGVTRWSPSQNQRLARWRASCTPSASYYLSSAHGSPPPQALHGHPRPRQVCVSFASLTRCSWRV